MGSDVMLPTISAGDPIVIDKGAYADENPSRGQIVAHHIPDAPEDRIGVLRVVAVGGDTMRVAEGKLYVNDMDEPWDESPYINEPMQYDVAKTTIPEGHVYLLGDNRNDAFDSHYFGPLRLEDVVGRVVDIRED